MSARASCSSPSWRGKRTAVGYLATMIVEVVLLAVGVLSLLMIVPLAEQAADAGPAGAGWAQALGSLAVQANTMAYQVAEMSLAVGGCVPVLAAAPDRSDPPTVGDPGPDRLPDSRRRHHRRALRDPHRPSPHDPRRTLRTRARLLPPHQGVQPPGLRPGP